MSGEVNEIGKRSFLRLPVTVDVERMSAECRLLSADWADTYWEIHGSSQMVLLRGGQSGTEADFTTVDVADQPVLDRLPYTRSLIESGGPFGGATFAFLFRMAPSGRAVAHEDSADVWTTHYRIHLPVTTNDGSFLLAEGRAKHLAVGEVWTFDNQEAHGAVNGDTARVHLILDVPPNPRLDALLSASTWDPGEERPDLWTQVMPGVESSEGTLWSLNPTLVLHWSGAQLMASTSSPPCSIPLAADLVMLVQAFAEPTQASAGVERFLTRFEGSGAAPQLADQVRQALRQLQLSAVLIPEDPYLNASS